MTPEQFQLFLKSNEEATARAIEKHVNGKIRFLDEKFSVHMKKAETHWEKSNKFMEELKPARDGIMTMQSLNRFFKWLGLPALGATVAYWILK